MAENIKLGVDTSNAEREIEDFARSVNDMLSAKGKASGKAVRLYDAKADLAELKAMQKALQDVIRLHGTIRGPMNSIGQNTARNFNQINASAIFPNNPQQQAKFMADVMAQTMRRHFSSGSFNNNTGLDYQDITGHHPRGSQHASGGGSWSNIASQGFQGLTAAGAPGRMAVGAVNGAGAAKTAGLGGLGMLKGAGLAGLAIGAFEAVSAGVGAVSDKMDAGKTENIELDKFKRSLGLTSDTFSQLKDKTRAVAESFNLTYEQSRKLTTEFASIARTNVNGEAQASEGIGLAQATGVDESQGSTYMATLRRDGSLGEKKADARLLAVQFAEALKRTGSTLNASDLMHSISGFSSSTAQRSLLAPNIEGYSGILSAMVGSGTPGLSGNVNNAAAIIGKADSAFQSGGSMGEASKTLQFLALGGQDVGLLGVKMRQAAGMFATGDQVFAKGTETDKFLGGSMSKFGGNKSGLSQVLDMITSQGGSKENQLMAAGNHFQNMNPEQMATLFNLHNAGQLSGMTSEMAKSEYRGIKFDKMSSAGYMGMSEVLGKDADLSGIRSKFSKLDGLSPDQKKQLDDAKGLSGNELKVALVKFTTTLEREKTAGEEAQATASEISRSTSRIADGLIPLAQTGNNFLSALVEQLAPDTKEGKRIRTEKTRAEFESGEKSTFGRNSYYDGMRHDASKKPGAKEAIALLNKQQDEEMGFMSGTRGRPTMPVGKDERRFDSKSGSVTPEMREMMRANDAKLAKINPGWQAGLTEAQLKQESGFNPNALSSQGAKGYAQFTDKTRLEWERRTGKKFDPGNFSDALELHRLQTTENLGGGRSVDDALRTYHGGPNKRMWGPKNAAYVGDVRRHLPSQIPEGDPVKAAEKSVKVSFSMNPVNVNTNATITLIGGDNSRVVNMAGSSVMKPQGQGAVR